VRARFPQCLLLNGGGVGGEARARSWRPSPLPSSAPCPHSHPSLVICTPSLTCCALSAVRQAREKLSNRVALRLLLNPLPALTPRWVRASTDAPCQHRRPSRDGAPFSLYPPFPAPPPHSCQVLLPTIYSDHLAVAALARLGGPRNVALRHPAALKFQASGGGELLLPADDLDGAPPRRPRRPRRPAAPPPAYRCCPLFAMRGAPLQARCVRCWRRTVRRR